MQLKKTLKIGGIALLVWGLFSLFGGGGFGSVVIDSTLSGTATSTINSSQNTKLTDGLVGLWSMNGEDLTTTTATDGSGTGNNGTLTNTPVPVVGRVGQAVDMNGSTSYVQVADDNTLDITSTITLGGWIKVNNSEIFDRNQYFIDKQNDYSFLVEDDEKITFVGLDLSTVLTTTVDTISIGNWHHIMATYDSGGGSNNTKIYIDGVLSTEATRTGTLGTNTLPLRIGCYSNSGGSCSNSWGLDGSADEVRIYNRALSADEIYHLYDLGNSFDVNSSQNVKATDNLVGGWSYDGSDLTTTTITDITGGGANGTISGDPVPAIGVSGQALEFDGTGDYASIANESTFDFDYQDSFTITSWVKPEESGANQAIISKLASSGNLEGWELRQGQSSDDKLTFLFINNNGTGNSYVARTDAALAIGEWQHVAAEFDGTDVRFYIDGVVQAKTTVTNALSASTLNNLNPYLGSRQGTQIIYEGGLDETRVYDTSLTAAEIKHLYDIGR